MKKTEASLPSHVHTLRKFLIEEYRYTRTYDPYGYIKRLVETKKLHARSLSFESSYVCGFFTVTELGKTWLEFQEL